jgi:hypothetical protein
VDCAAAQMKYPCSLLLLPRSRRSRLKVRSSGAVQIDDETSLRRCALECRTVDPTMGKIASTYSWEEVVLGVVQSRVRNSADEEYQKYYCPIF